MITATPGRLEAGPYRTLDLVEGGTAPWYIVPFDKEGRCEAPRTRAHLLSTLRAGDFTDVVLFSHGWNNDWETASRRYDHFLNGYTNMVRSRDLSHPSPFRPLLIGIIWPATALVMPWEEGPSFAGGTPGIDDEQVGQERREIQALADQLRGGARERLYELAQREGGLTAEEAVELARILAPFYATKHDDLTKAGGAPPPDEIVRIWEAASRDAAATGPAANRDGEFGLLPETPSSGVGPQAAGVLGWLNPRDAVRAATVLLMKDRAGTVGAGGVGPLVRDILAQSTARLHMVGHSYGAKIVLSALCAKEVERPATSLLLLQPAVSHLCFAANVPGTRRPGGYRAALARTTQPILTTFSTHDVPLTRLFHQVVRRAADLGEARIAGVAPSDYAALGGFGPGGTDEDSEEIAIPALGQKYEFGPNAPEIYGLEASGAIGGHGDISNEHTWWALYSQVIKG
jgi:hypothetical protein